MVTKEATLVCIPLLAEQENDCLIRCQASRVEIKWKGWGRAFHHRLSSGILQMVLAHSHAIAVISAHPVLQKIWKLWRHYKLPGSLILCWWSAAPCASIHFEDFSCHHLLPNPNWVHILQPARHSLGLYYLFRRFLPLPAAPCLPFPAVWNNTGLWDQLFSPCKERREEEQFPQ